MSLLDRIKRSFQEGDLMDAFLDRMFAVPHVKIISAISGQYLMSQHDVTIDLSTVSLRPLVKYRLRKGKLQYEKIEAKYINEYLPEEGAVVDLGAGTGFTSILAAKQSSHKRNIISVEANPSLENVILHNSRLNDVEIVVLAAAYDPSNSRKKISMSSRDFRASSTYGNSKSDIEVKAINISDIIEENDIQCMSLLVDIEGSEGDLIMEEMELLEEYCRMMIIEMHPEKNKTVKEARSTLRKSTFEQIDSKDQVYVFTNASYEFPTYQS